jgi:hypothetical protein
MSLGLEAGPFEHDLEALHARGHAARWLTEDQAFPARVGW